MSCINEGVGSCVFIGLKCVAMCCTTLLWLAMKNHLLCGFEHADSRCNYVSIALWGQRVQFWFWVCGWPKNVFCGDCPCYCYHQTKLFD